MPHSAHWLALTYALLQVFPTLRLTFTAAPCQFNPFGPSLPPLFSALAPHWVTPELRGTQWLGSPYSEPPHPEHKLSFPSPSAPGGEGCHIGGYDSPLPQLGVPRPRPPRFLGFCGEAPQPEARAPTLVTDSSRRPVISRNPGLNPQPAVPHPGVHPRALASGASASRRSGGPLLPGWRRGTAARTGGGGGGGEGGAPPGHRPLPMVEMCEEWNSLSVKRHSRQVLPTPESPIRSSRNSTSYCFAMAGPERAGGCGRRAQPCSAGAIAARARPAENGAGGEKGAGLAPPPGRR